MAECRSWVRAKRLEAEHGRLLALPLPGDPLNALFERAVAERIEELPVAGDKPTVLDDRQCEVEAIVRRSARGQAQANSVLDQGAGGNQLKGHSEEAGDD